MGKMTGEVPPDRAEIDEWYKSLKIRYFSKEESGDDND